MLGGATEGVDGVDENVPRVSFWTNDVRDVEKVPGTVALSTLNIVADIR